MLVLCSTAGARKDPAWLRYERTLLLDGDPLNAEGRVIPVRLDDIDLPRDLAPFQAIDFTASDGLERILAACDLAAGDRRKPQHDFGGTGLDDPVLGFWGRDQQLAAVRRWVLEDSARVVAITGVAGIGKTTLVRAFLQAPEVRRRFVIVCRSLFNPIPLPDLLGQLLGAASGQQVVAQTSEPRELVSRLFEVTQENPALIVLDNLESVFDPSTESQRLQSAYADFDVLLQRFASSAHRNCLLLTCREDVRMLGRWTTATGPAYQLQLHGVGAESTRAIFMARGDFRAEAGDWDRLATLYGGHPYALQLASHMVATAHGGDVGEFLATDPSFIDGLEELFAWHVERLTPEEREVVYWLAISRQPMPLSELKDDLLSEAMRLRAAVVVDSLQQKISLEIVDKRFSLQPSMVEFMTQRLVKTVTDRLIEEITSELLSTRLHVLNTHALLKTQSSQHVRKTQRRLILRPILDAVSRHLPAGRDTVATLNTVLDVLRRDYRGRATYAPGTILNMLVQLGVDLRGFDFSRLCIWQADLEGVNLQGVDFSESRFAKCCFTQTFGTIQAIAFDTTGEAIAAGDTSGFIHVWRLLDGQLRYRVHAHENWVRRLLFVDGGRQLVSAGDDHTIGLWDAASGRRLHTFTGHTNWVSDLAYHVSSRVLASASEDGTVRLWNLAAPGDGELGMFRVAEAGVRSIVFNTNGHELACGCSDGQLRTLALLLRRIGPPVAAHQGSVNALAYVSDTVLASGGTDGRLRLWDATNLQERGELASAGGEILSLAAHREMHRLASASRDGVVRLWDMGTGRPMQALQGHTGAVNSIDISADGRAALSAGDDQSIRLWTLADGNCVRQLVGYVRVAWVVAWSPDGSRLATGHDDHRIRIWDVRSGTCLITLDGHHKWVQGVAWSPDGRRLASASADGTVRVWQLETRQCQRELTEHTHWVVSVSWSPDGALLASGSRDGTVRIWDAWTGRCLDVLRGHRSWVWAVRFSPDGTRLASGGEDGCAIIWDVASRTQLGEMAGHRRGVWCLSWSRDATRLATAGVDGDIGVWDTRQFAETNRLKGHASWIGGIDFHPGGRLIATGSADATIRVWDLDRDGAQQQLFTGHESWIWSVAWSPDGTQLASASQDETVRLWQSADGESAVLRTPRPYEGMKIRGATGLTAAEREMLSRLGAIDDVG
jgi:WD40 repeat protein